MDGSTKKEAGKAKEFMKKDYIPEGGSGPSTDMFRRSMAPLHKGWVTPMGEGVGGQCGAFLSRGAGLGIICIVPTISYQFLCVGHSESPTENAVLLNLCQ